MKKQKKNIIRIFGIILAVFVCNNLSAQEATNGYRHKRYYNFDYIKNSNLLTNSYNPVGIANVAVDKISYAEAFFDKSQGGFVNYYQSDDSYSFGARSESYMKIKNISYYGYLDYSNFMGKNMSGSMLINPYFYPIDIVEYTPGTKNLETYNLVGAVSFPISQKFRGGAKLNYQSANYAKRHDLRHENRSMDLSASLAITYSTSRFDYGLAYIYERATELLNANIFGEQGLMYDAFLNKGIWFGALGVWDSPGLHLKNSPMFLNNVNGVSLNITYKPNDALNFVAEGSYKNKKGEIGQTGRKWAHPTADIFEFKTLFSAKQGKNMHVASVFVDLKQTNNTETFYDYISSGGINQAIALGKRNVFNGTALQLKAGYDYYINVQNFNPLWKIHAGIAFNSMSQESSLVYPYIKSNSYNISEFNAELDKCFLLDRAKINLRVGALFAKGTNGGIKEKISSADGTIPTEYAPHDTQTYDYEMEYLCAERFNVSAGVKFSYFVNSKSSLYIDSEFSYAKANKLLYLKSNNFSVFSLKVGFLF